MVLLIEPVALAFISSSPHPASVRPLDLQQIGSELAIRWDDGAESFITLEALRRSCPCAACLGEKDVLGKVYKNPVAPLGPRSFVLTKIESVGGYAVKPVWADGHLTGIFSFDYLRRLGGAQST